MEEAIVEAVKLGVGNQVEELLSKGVDPNTVDENGAGLLHLASSVDDSKTVALLLKYGYARNALTHFFLHSISVICNLNPQKLNLNPFALLFPEYC